MSALLRQLVLTAAAAGLSWWLFLAVSPRTIAPPLPEREPPPIEVTVLPRVRPVEEVAPTPEAPEAVAETAEQPPEPAPAAAPPEPQAEANPEESAPEPATESAPPTPELGDPEGEGELAAAEARVAAEDAVGDPARRPADELMSDESLLEDARREVEGETRRGFATVLESSPAEQLEIARFFGEELVLVPRAALDTDDEAAQHFRLGPGGEVEAVSGLPPLDRYHQYRDLFHYEYAKLPAPLRELRRTVLGRNEIYLFAALLPLREWALVVGRREEALAKSGREAGEVRRFVLQYVRPSGGGFDLRVEEIVFADGTRHVPPPAPPR